ncbi:MAG: hypothetical protein IJO70_11875 [Lachnospiraceae bacterium]|nr:hypothetical protein [Lachnospiraceae bacterium]
MNDKRKTLFIYSSIMLVLAFFMLLVIEGDHLLRCGILDDMNLINNTLNKSFFEAVFKGGYKFRPISNGIMWMVYHLVDGNLYLYGYINIFFSALCVSIIFAFVLEFTKSYIVSALAGILYVFSRFSYYQVTQMFGVMETTSTILGICTVYLLYKYIDSKSSKYYYLSILACVFASLSHERYLTLFPVIIITWFMVDIKGIMNNKSIKELVKPVVWLIALGLVLVLFKLFVNNVMVGTGGTDVTETFNLKSLIINLKKSIAYLFSVNLEAGDMYLNMISWNQYTEGIKRIVYISNISILILVVAFIIGFIREDKESKANHIKSIIVFILSIGALLIISSVTIRVELRWMYFPYTVMVIMISYMACKCNVNKYLNYLKYFVFVVYALTTICFSLYCREYYTNLYYWRLYSVGNDLIDETYGEYGEEMYDKSWIIVSDIEELNSYEDMLNVYNTYDKYELKIEVINNIEELSGIESVQEKEVLYFDTNDWDFKNITDVIKGYYN